MPVVGVGKPVPAVPAMFTVSPAAPMVNVPLSTLGPTVSTLISLI